jgi:hypothetical protein
LLQHRRPYASHPAPWGPQMRHTAFPLERLASQCCLGK